MNRGLTLVRLLSTVPIQAFDGEDEQLGRVAARIANRVRKGYGAVKGEDRRERFINEVLYRFQAKGIPIGTQVTKRPPDAEMIALQTSRPNVPTVASDTGLALRTAGSAGPDLTHVLYFWFSDPARAFFPQRCPFALKKKPQETDGVSWLGKADFAKSKVAFVLTACSLLTEADPFNLYVESRLRRAGHEGADMSILDLAGDLLRRTPRIRVRKAHGIAGEEGGCACAATPMNDARNGAGLLLLLLAAAWVQVRSRRRWRSNT
jgi:hypothetical protein